MDSLTIGIVGLGLMGGSFGKVLKKYNLAKKIVGYDHNISHQKEALSLKLVDKIVELEELKRSDLIVLAIPVDAIIAFLPKLVGVSKNTTIMDFGSTKKLIVDNIPKSLRPNYIPAHPMTGTEKFGPSAAIDKLYENKTIVLCDLDICDPIHKERVLNIFKTIKMNITFMNSATHDIHACYISHMPHAISFALANTVMNHEDPKHIISLAGGGFRSMSRIAKSSPAMWTDIFRQNRSNMIDSLDEFDKQMQLIRKIIEDEDYEQMYSWMEKANTLHDILD
jgi:prephenate dehydrogenase